MTIQTFFEFKDFYRRYQGKDLRLVVLKDTSGSTYQKAGALKLIHISGSSSGLISGGCLEKEIIKRSLVEEAFEIDSRSEGDRFWGYGLGCSGTLKLCSQPASSNWNEFCLRQLEFDEEQIPSLNLVGALEDTVPLAEMIRVLRWPFRVLNFKAPDHPEFRKNKIRANIAKDPDDVDYSKNPQIFLLISHSYEYDLSFLKKAIELDSPFVGILGPNEKKQQMLADLKRVHHFECPESKKQDIHAPIGSKELGRGPHAIALSIVSELQKKVYSYGLR